MKKLSSLVSTSVEDAKSTLECTLLHDPQQALANAEMVLGIMNSFPHDQPSRRKMLKTIINRANKALKAQRGES